MPRRSMASAWEVVFVILLFCQGLRGAASEGSRKKILRSEFSIASHKSTAARVAAELLGVSKRDDSTSQASTETCRHLEAARCQQTDGCMWHEKACVPRPQNSGNLHCYNRSSWDTCFDVAACARNGPSGPTPDAKWAFVWTNSAPQDLHDENIANYEMNIASQVNYAKAMGNMDVILLIPKFGAAIDGMNGQAYPLPDKTREKFEKLGVQIREVEWALPPGMLYLPKVPWCGSKDFMRLHVMGLEGYAAVVYTDFDVQLIGSHPDTKQLFQCAAQDKILWTGDVMGPINIGVFAVRPHPAIKEAGLILAQNADFSETTGWGDAGFAPFTGKFIGAECGQGFYKTMFFQDGYSPVQSALQQAGMKPLDAHMIDLCKWNYLHGWECPKEYPCDDVVFIHKDSFDKGGCRQQQKYGFYVHTYHDPAAVVKQLRDIREKFRNSPVYVLSDGGLNFSKACDEIQNCEFQWKPPANARWNPKPFLDRFRDAARWLNSEYVIYLEPDTTLHQHITRLPKADAGGLRDNFNPVLSRELRRHLVELGRNASGRNDFKLLWDRFGLAGGSIFRTEAVLTAFRPDNINWKHMEMLEGVRVYSSDIAMAIALAVHGFSYYPWEEVKVGPNSKWIEAQPRRDSAFQHHGTDEPEGKPLYGKSLEGKDAELVSGPPKNVVEVTCQHCVWVADEDCFRPDADAKISCPISEFPV